MRSRTIALFGLLVLWSQHASLAAAQDWQPLAADLIQREKPGFGGLSGVVIDRGTGAIFICVSDRGLFRSTDAGRTWQRHSEAVKGRTETPGCLQLDPAGS